MCGVRGFFLQVFIGLLVYVWGDEWGGGLFLQVFTDLLVYVWGGGILPASVY